MRGGEEKRGREGEGRGGEGRVEVKCCRRERGEWGKRVRWNGREGIFFDVRRGKDGRRGEGNTCEG